MITHILFTENSTEFKRLYAINVRVLFTFRSEKAASSPIKMDDNMTWQTENVCPVDTQAKLRLRGVPVTTTSWCQSAGDSIGRYTTIIQNMNEKVGSHRKVL